MMTDTEQPAQILLPTENGGSVKFSLGIVNSFRTHTENRTDPTIQPTIVHSNQATRIGHSDQENFPIGSL